MVLCIIPLNFRPIPKSFQELTVETSSPGPGASVFWKFQSSVEQAKIGRSWPFWTAMCFMILCINPPDFRPTAEIIKELECVVHQTWSKRQSSNFSKFRGTRQNWPSMAILDCDLLRGTAHLPKKCQVYCWIAKTLKAVMSFGTDGRAGGR